MKRIIILLIAFVAGIESYCSGLSQNSPIGHWETDSNGLPVFCYTGDLPYQNEFIHKNSLKLPDDPWFILGNYRLTIFPHVSGSYEILCGERSWIRTNQIIGQNCGYNKSLLTVNDSTYNLVGENSLAFDSEICKRKFGCGYVEFTYNCDSIEIARTLEVAPSNSIDDGYSAIVIKMSVYNHSNSEKQYSFSEEIGANIVPAEYQARKEKDYPVKYDCNPSLSEHDNLAYASVDATYSHKYIVQRTDKSIFDLYPPMPYIRGFKCSESTAYFGEHLGKDVLGIRCSGSIPANGTVELYFVCGYVMEQNMKAAKKQSAELFRLYEKHNGFKNLWKQKLPDIKESDEDLKRELIWHSYVLESMATYSEHYKETKIPQGTAYDYQRGSHASARDNFQHALPLIYYNPELAKSTIRYLMKRTDATGHIMLCEKGNGYCFEKPYYTSDQQLFFFLLIGEYLRVTKDYSFLKEKITPYPQCGHGTLTISECIRNCFLFLRDEIGTGGHGLVRLLNSDWNDSVYYIEKQPYNTIFFRGESHMNTAMAIPILETLAEECKNGGMDPYIIKDILDYSTKLNESLMKDLGNKKFPLRMYFAGKSYGGNDNMFLEPMGYMMQNPNLDTERKAILYEEMVKRLYNGEKLGARQQESPADLGGHHIFDKGSRENGGFWWALNGPVIIGLNTFDKDEAWKRFKQMTFINYSKEFPEYWTSYWSASDNVESSLIIGEGLPDQSSNYHMQPVFCAHPHAWILYSYFKLTE